MKIVLLSIVSIASVVGIVLSPVAASAASTQGTSITTSPVSVDLNGAPGSTVSTTLQVENNGTTAINLAMELDTFKAAGTSGQAQILLPTQADNYLNWVQFSPATFVAQPGVWTSVKMTINIPNDAGSDYYYAVLFKPILSANNPSHAAVIKASNSVLVLLNTASGNAHPQISLTSFTANHSLYEYLPATFSIAVHNTGNVFLPPKGDIYISRSSSGSNPIDTITVNPYGGNVLPATSRVFTSQWQDGFPVFVPKTVDGQPVTTKEGQQILRLDWNFSHAQKLRFGKYYAKLVLVYNNGQRDVPIQATLSFWVIPWKLIGGVVIVLALIAAGLWTSSRTVQRQVRKVSHKIHRK